MTTSPPPPAGPISPVKRAQIESQERIKTSRDKILVALDALHPEEQLETAQAVLNALHKVNELALKKQQLAKLREELGEA